MIELRAEFGKEAELKEDTGMLHDYLGMQINFSLPERVAVIMFNYLEDIVVEAPDELKPNNCKYPTNNKLFNVDKNLPLLDNTKLDLFH